MGSCFSCVSKRSSLPPPPPTAKVISLDGHLREYPIPISVSRVLHTESSYSSTTTPADCFLANSDRLYYDDYIPPLDSHDLLHPYQIYFVLPTSKLQRRLTASDMAALAVKASLAIQNASNTHLSPKNARISPLLIVNHLDLQPHVVDVDKDQQISPPFKSKSVSDAATAGISRSSSVRKLQRFTSRRAKMAVRSFRLRLSTIYEGTIL